jgi:tetratricopeptide (TPR) repeat protein
VRLRSLLPLLVIAGSAHADVWKRAIEKTPSSDAYEGKLSEGDEAALAANAKNISLAEVRRKVDVAIAAYRAAAQLRPKAAEPYFRIGTTLNVFFLDCGPPDMWHPPTCQSGGNNNAKAKEVVEAWDAFEQRAPLDPRVNELLLQRAILRTKLLAIEPAHKEHLDGALRDYEAVLDREDGMTWTLGRPRHLLLGNLAETYMMVGKLDEAIETYKQAIREGGHSSTAYGLAVALDRDESGATALAIIRDQGVDEYEKFKMAFLEQLVFYVPAGEEEYYFALIDEAFGNLETSVGHWKRYIASGAHPQYQPRAKAHLDAMLAKKSSRWRELPPPDPFRDLR